MASSGMAIASIAPRLPWREGFPDVVIHADLKGRDDHPGYAAAKSGDADWAVGLALDLAQGGDAMRQLAKIIQRRETLLIPVIADETAGFNAIPDAMAHVIAYNLRAHHGLHVEAVSGKIVQVNKVGHTRAPSFQRMVTPAVFDGLVERGRSYVLVDDHVGLGGTLASLRGYVEGCGGTVIAMTTLTESREARRIALSPDTLNMLKDRHGKDLDTFWRSQFGYGIDCLTEVEAVILCRQQSVAAIEDFLAQAAIEARGRGLEPAVG